MQSYHVSEEKKTEILKNIQKDYHHVYNFSLHDCFITNLINNAMIKIIV